jgi:N-methylhydantoinase A
MERKGATIGILTNEGFEDVIIMGRQWRSDMYSLVFDSETPTFLCARQRIRGIRGRLDYLGNITTELSEKDVIQAVDDLVTNHHVQSIAVCYLFSFFNPAHERRTEQLIRKHYPDVRVSLSSTINPRFREYERTCITAFDAYVGPIMEDYIRGLQREMRERSVEVVLQVMQSRGGITSGSMCIERPVVTLLSGPAGGVAGGIFVGNVCGRDNLITLDMGGTTNDVALVREGKPFLSLDGRIDKYPLRQAMIDITTIGAGGGSIAWVDNAGGLKVGPESSGADPGPVCYDRGGKEPTVTDSSVTLGYLNPEYFAAGELVLKPELARKAIENRIARPLEMTTIQAAAGIQRIVNNNMADQIRLVTVHRGYHPKDFSLVAFGGAGPVIAGRLMQILGIKEIIVPINPGVLSAFGLLVADIEHEEVVSFKVEAAKMDPKDMTNIFRELEEACEQKREKIGISETHLEIHHSTEMRYIGQSYELEVPVTKGRNEITRETIDNVVSRFHETHQNIYQHSSPDSPVEFIAFRTVFSEKPSPTPVIPRLKTGTKAIPKGKREVFFEEYEGFVDVTLYDRGALFSGQRLVGPVIVEQSDTTTVIYPNQVCEVDQWGNLVITEGTE